MNAKEIIQQVSIKLGFDVPKSIEDTTNGNTQRLLGQLNSVVRELVLDYDWQCLIRQTRFTTNHSNQITDNGVSGYQITTLAHDFGCFITHYLYNNTTRKIINEITLDRYELDNFYTTPPLSAPMDTRFIFIQSMICFSPDLHDGQKISFFYKSKFPVYRPSQQSEADMMREYFSKDLEESVFDSTLLILGTIWKYKDEMGFDYAESYRSYERYLNKLKDQDALRTIVDGNRYSKRYPFVNIPDTGFGIG